MTPSTLDAAIIDPPILTLRGLTTVAPPRIDIGRDLGAREWRAGEPARITVTRQAPDDAGYREVYVSVDGTRLAVLEYGDSVTSEVNAGPHRLRAHNTLFWKTHDIVLRPGEHARFVAVNRTGSVSFGLLFMLGAFPIYLTFERQPADVPSRADDSR